MKREHPDDFDLFTARTEVKARWIEEEMVIMAKKEVELKYVDNVRFINQELAAVFTQRSIEAIKKER